jgi:peptide/nickel transport system permease protein
MKIITYIRGGSIIAWFSIFFICLVVLVALLGYWITPDKSSNANEMHLEVSSLSPGTVITYLQVESEKKTSQSIWDLWLNGSNHIPNRVPISQYYIKGDMVYYFVMGDSSKQELSIAAVASSEEDFVNRCVQQKCYYFGTDRYGRDMLSRMILGSRISLAVGVVAVFVSMLIGVLLGALAGYYGGRVDQVISWLINVIWSLPTLLLVIAITFSLGKGFWQVFIAIGLSMWVEVARLVRGQVLSIKERDFVEAARALGFKDLRIIFKHILPNMLGPLMVMASANFASAILLEAGLSFLGFGAQPPIPTWGGMVKEHYGYIIMDAAYLALIPGFAIMLLVYSFNIFSSTLGDWLES